MATTTKTSGSSKIVGALFDDHDDALNAVNALLDRGYLPGDIAISRQAGKPKNPKARRKALQEAGYNDPDSHYFDKSIEEGKTLVSVTHVPDIKTGEVVSILDHNGAHYNPDGKRNLRDDVVGMTTGAAIGLAAGAFAGPLGAAIGALAGSALGATVGAVMEQNE